MTENKNLYQKLLAVKKAVPYIQKDKEGHNYQYATPSAVLGTLNPLLNAEGLILKTEVLNVEHERIFLKPKMVDIWVDGKKVQEKVDVHETMYNVKMRMTWIDVDSGETLECDWASSGVNGDEKGLGSSYTYAERYFLLKFFNIPTDSDDPDAYQTKHMTQAEIDRKATEALTKLNEEVRAAIVSIDKSKTVDELKELRDSLREQVLKHPDFVLAARRKFEAINSGVTVVAAAAIPNDESNPSGLLKKVAEPVPTEKPVDEERELLIQKHFELFGAKPHGKTSNETIMNKIEDHMKNLEATSEPIPDVSANIMEEKKNDGFLKEMVEVSSEPELPAFELSTEEEIEEAIEILVQSAPLEIPYLDQIVKSGKMFTNRTSMAAWWSGNKATFQERLTEEEWATLNTEFGSHFNSIPI